VEQETNPANWQRKDGVKKIAGKNLLDARPYQEKVTSQTLRKSKRVLRSTKEENRKSGGKSTKRQQSKEK